MSARNKRSLTPTSRLKFSPPNILENQARSALKCLIKNIYILYSELCGGNYLQFQQTPSNNENSKLPMEVNPFLNR